MNRNLIQVSVIIPVYKAELYIERCARSLMEQTMKTGIEFLFINDCTPDDSMGVLQRVIEEYPDRLPQIRIINHTSNNGIAYTRGEGIREAKGDYIGWCDSDDWCEYDMFEKMYRATEEGLKEMVVCSTYRHAESGITVYKNYNSTTPEGYLKMIYTFPRWQYFSVLYSKLIRRSLFLDNGIYPYEGINRSEDLNVMIRICCEAKSIAFIEKELYHYNKMNSSSITHVGFNAKEDWRQQKKNVDLISDYLSLKKPIGWKTIIAFLQFTAKTECVNAFESVNDYYSMYRSSHWHILEFLSIPLKNRISMYLYYNMWVLFKYKNS